MNNRDTVIQLVKANVDTTLQDELSYQMELDREYPYDLADALSDVEDFAVEWKDRKLLKLVRGILIAANFYTLAPINTCSRDVRFSYNKEKYDCDESWESWIKA